MGPSGIGGPTPVDLRDPSGGPGTIPVTPETFPVAETGLPIYNLLGFVVISKIFLRTRKIM